MKIAEALLERSDLLKSIAQLDIRLNRSASVQEGDQPPEKPEDLLKEMMQAINKLETLINQINRTNCTINLPPYGSLADALTRRDMIMRKRTILQNLVETVSYKDPRYSHSEIKNVITVDVKEIQKQIDDLSKEFRLLDTEIQRMNWLTDLL